MSALSRLPRRKILPLDRHYFNKRLGRSHCITDILETAPVRVCIAASTVPGKLARTDAFHRSTSCETGPLELSKHAVDWAHVFQGPQSLPLDDSRLNNRWNPCDVASGPCGGGGFAAAEGGVDIDKRELGNPPSADQYNHLDSLPSERNDRKWLALHFFLKCLCPGSAMNIGNFENSSRTHDLFYLDEPRNAPPKEIFQFVCELLRDIGPPEPFVLADIGCAVGDFPALLTSVFPKSRILGLEYLHRLVEAARQNYPNVTFLQGDIHDPDAFDPDSLDIATAIGVIQIFDDIEPAVANMSRWVKPGGMVILAGLFNPDPVDVFVRYRTVSPVNQEVESDLQRGWNIVSQATVKRIFQELEIKDATFIPFELGQDLPRRPHDLLRSWTLNADGARHIINATRLLQPHFIVYGRIS